MLNPTFSPYNLLLTSSILSAVLWEAHCICTPNKDKCSEHELEMSINLLQRIPSSETVCFYNVGGYAKFISELGQHSEQILLTVSPQLTTAKQMNWFYFTTALPQWDSFGDQEFPKVNNENKTNPCLPFWWYYNGGISASIQGCKLLNKRQFLTSALRTGEMKFKRIPCNTTKKHSENNASC